MSKRQKNGWRSTKRIVEHQIDYKPLYLETGKTSEERRVKEPLSPIRITNREDMMNDQPEEYIGDETKYLDKDSILSDQRANKIEAGTLMKHGTFIVENCGNRIFLLPVIYNESYTKRKTLTNLDGFHNFGDFWTFWVSSSLTLHFNMQLD